MSENDEITKLKELLKRKGLTNSVKKSIEDRLKALTDDKEILK